ncbi:SigE family RNA polymerase sigma factor [Catenulispora rubra]|uniref:SigE family RNA polymerase sigma factor n=1 Tax=Catenulispora rubra TaxID=280293 RepID=UPI001891FA52|nr:SigE family RNA polymerase sigma factor [Catenulispora rubra]
MRDTTDFDAFYAASVRRVTGHVYAMTGSRADAEDLTQDAFAKAWQHWDRVSTHPDPEAWVRVVAFRAGVSAWRRAVGRARAHRRHGPPEQEPEASVDNVAIIAALRRIPAVQRQAIVLHHLVGQSLEEIAAETGVAVGTVKARLSRGRQALSPHLSDRGNDFGSDQREVPGHA